MRELVNPFDNDGECFLWESDDYGTSWISVLEAEKRIAVWEEAVNARSILVEHLMNGVCAAGAVKAFVKASKMKYSDDFDTFDKILDHFNKPRYRTGEMSRVFGHVDISKEFWQSLHVNANSTWNGGRGFLWAEGAFSDWARGEFGVFVGSAHDSLSDQVFLGRIIKLYGVRILEEDIDAIAPKRSQKSDSIVGRPTRFNWEVAFADVAAWLHSDADIPDINALGVQAQIIERLRKSFIARGTEVPEDTSLKNKAKIIMGALRSI